MKKSQKIRILLLAAYCIPYAFLCVNGNAASGTMLWYAVMAAAFALLYCAALRTRNIVVLYIGNIVSFGTSWVAAKLSGLEPMGYYFKPFTSHSLITVISVIVLMIQTVLLLICFKRANRKKQA